MSLFNLSYSQNSLSELLKEYNTESIPYILAEDLSQLKDNVILLDTRETYEYQTSHIKNSICVGYDNFDITRVEKKIKDKNQLIVVYCSLGIRSEDIAEQLKASGYTNVKNLYGGIFEWKNKSLNTYNSKELLTDSVHTFEEEWSKWLKKGIKIFPKPKE
ncbi:rhodanese-like domain-containing protein [Winogradskyella sp.]|uniref:rhodanese-like domain-containing protein n=1 Tax=Winogradskyella sp. TaxID=1883156 RepID=UPI0025F26636|nr:rhodanese-like domain-containing protein [Winogradskyella sp.]